MTLRLSDDARKQALASIKRYFDEELDQDIGDLKAEMMLDFITKEIAPVAYNEAIRDAQKLLQERVGDLDNTLFANEFGYWPAKRK